MDLEEDRYARTVVLGLLAKTEGERCPAGTLNETEKLPNLASAGETTCWA